MTRALVGRHRVAENATWVAVQDGTANRFLNRHGVLFEDNQGSHPNPPPPSPQSPRLPITSAPTPGPAPPLLRPAHHLQNHFHALYAW